MEYARLASARQDLHELLGEAVPPTAVQEVLSRRVDRLPEETVQVLRVASVLGRRFDLTTLASVAEADEDDLLDLVEPAQAAGLVREDGVERFAFGHALVRDTVYAGLSPTRRGRLHARAGEALTGLPGRTTEEARHWLAAGPSRADRAWRSAADAAEVARRAHAHEEAADLLRAALTALDQDAAATAEDRYELLMSLVVAHRWSAQWEQPSPPSSRRSRWPRTSVTWCAPPGPPSPRRRAGCGSRRRPARCTTASSRPSGAARTGCLPRSGRCGAAASSAWPSRPTG